MAITKTERINSVQIMLDAQGVPSAYIAMPRSVTTDSDGGEPEERDLPPRMISAENFAAIIGEGAQALASECVTEVAALRAALAQADEKIAALSQEAAASRMAADNLRSKSESDLASRDRDVQRLEKALAAAAAEAQAKADAEAKARMVVSDRQFAQALAMAGIITKDEAVAWVASGTLPAAMAAIVEAMPESQRFGAQMLLQGATTFDAANPLVAQMAAAAGMTDAQVAELFRVAAAL